MELPRGPAPQSRESVMQNLRDTWCPQSPFTLNSSFPFQDLGIMRMRTVGTPKASVMMPGPSCFCTSPWALTPELLPIRRWPWTFFPVSIFLSCFFCTNDVCHRPYLIRVLWGLTGGNVLKGSVPGKDALSVSWESRKNATLWQSLRTSLGNLQRTQNNPSQLSKSKKVTPK